MSASTSMEPTPTGRQAMWPVCDQTVSTEMRNVKKRGVVECFAVHPNPHPAAVGYQCCESGDPT